MANVSDTSFQSCPVVFSITAQPVSANPSGPSTARHAVFQTGAGCNQPKSTLRGVGSLLSIVTSTRLARPCVRMASKPLASAARSAGSSSTSVVASSSGSCTICPSASISDTAIQPARPSSQGVAPVPISRPSTVAARRVSRAGAPCIASIRALRSDSASGLKGRVAKASSSPPGPDMVRRGVAPDGSASRKDFRKSSISARRSVRRRPSAPHLPFGVEHRDPGGR